MIRPAHGISSGYLLQQPRSAQVALPRCAICRASKGVKWATPNPLKLAEARAACDPAITCVGGLVEVWAPSFYAVGARGFP
jgi:4-hydroxy-tetrahydrodipicolinate synthase